MQWTRLQLESESMTVRAVSDELTALMTAPRRGDGPLVWGKVTPTTVSSRAPARPLWAVRCDL